MSENNGIITPEDLIKKGRREVELPSGVVVLVGKVKRAHLAYYLECLPLITTFANAKKRPAMKSEKEIAQAEAAVNKVILSGVIKPKLYEDPEEGPTPGDFDYEDQVAVFNSILEQSGFSKEKAEAALPLSKTGT